MVLKKIFSRAWLISEIESISQLFLIDLQAATKNTLFARLRLIQSYTIIISYEADLSNNGPTGLRETNKQATPCAFWNFLQKILLS